MPGIFIIKGTDIRISGISIPIDGSPPPSINLQVRSETWHHWLLTACDNTALAITEETVLHAVRAREEVEGELGDLKREAIEAEFRAAMTAISACAFAVDAFYTTLVARFGGHPDAAKWNANKTARHARISATFHYMLKLKGAGMPAVQDFIEKLFKFRDWAAHPPFEYQDAIQREDMDAGVEPRFITFSALHARKVLSLTVELMSLLVLKADEIATDEPQTKWMEFAKARILEVRARATIIDGVSFPESELD